MGIRRKPTSSIGAKEVVGHVGVEVEVVRVVQEVSGHMVYKYVSLPFLGRMFELLVIVVDDLRERSKKKLKKN